MIAMKISIIIPTLKESSTIAATLTHLKKELRRTDHEVIVSDGGSTDDTVVLAKQLASRVCEWKEKSRQTIAQGKNIGAKAAQGDFLVFLDADTVIPHADNFFFHALEYFARDEKLVGLTCRIRVLPQYETFADRIFFSFLTSWYIFFNNYLHIGNSSGEFQMIRRAAFERIGGFREDLVAGEDNDLFIRLARIGNTRVATPLTIFHSGRRAHKMGWPKLLSHWVLNGISVFLFRKSPFKEWKVIR